jgi:hypothetical protein
MLQGTLYATLFSLGSIISTILAIIMLFSVLYTFGKSIPLVTTGVSMILPIITITVSVILGLFLWETNTKIRNRFQSKTPKYLQASLAVAVLSSFGFAFTGFYEIVKLYFNSEAIGQMAKLSDVEVILAYFFIIANAVHISLLKRATKKIKVCRNPADEVEDDLVGCQY